MIKSTVKRGFSLCLLGIAAAGLSTGCSIAPDARGRDLVTKVLLQPQSLFAPGAVLATCPSEPKSTGDPTPAPKAVCVEVKNTGTDRATFRVAVTVQNAKEETTVYSQVIVTTGLIAPGETGAGASAAGGTENIVTKPTKDQKAAGIVPANDIRLNITQVDRIPG